MCYTWRSKKEHSWVNALGLMTYILAALTTGLMDGGSLARVSK